MSQTTAPVNSAFPTALHRISAASTVQRVLFSRVDVASIALFRIAFGAIILWEVERYLGSDQIREYWIRTVYHFPFEWFPWVQPWEGAGMFIHFALIGVASFMMMVGLLYRLSAVLVFLSFTFVFLAEQTRYLNHFYLVALLSFLMIFIPAHRAWSVDAVLRSGIRRSWAPSWTLTLLRLQVGVVYFFGGVAKLDYDWLVRAEPMRDWLAARQDFPAIGQFFTTAWMPYAMSISGAAIDLAAPFLLLHRKSCPFMLAVILAFHFMNDRLFTIGIFPWLAIVASTLFLPADWPRRLGAEAKARPGPILGGGVVGLLLGLYLHGGPELIPALIAPLGGALVVWTFFVGFRPQRPPPTRTLSAAPGSPWRQVTVGLVVVWATAQILLPLRHYWIPGVVGWTEEGQRFAWRMKLRSKAGRARFYAYDPRSGTRYEIPTDSLLTTWQYTEMAARPHLLRLFARHLKQGLIQEGKSDYEIRVVAYASLNFRPFTLLVDSTVDLATQRYSEFGHSPWILQLQEQRALPPSGSFPGAASE